MARIVMAEINMSLDYIAYIPAIVAILLGTANVVVIVMKLLHRDQLVRSTLDSFASFIWIFRLGGGAGYWKDRRHTYKADGAA
jgi:hypothetical protein